MMAGQVSPIYGVAEPAQVLRCRAEIRLPGEHAIVVQALAAEGEAPGELLRAKTQSPQTPAAGNTVYEYRENGRAHCLIFRDSKETSWNFGDWASDADFLYYCTEAQRISHLVACHATFVKYRGEPLVSASSRVERFEYWDHDGQRHLSSSDQEALVGFSDTTLASWDAGVVG